MSTQFEPIPNGAILAARRYGQPGSSARCPPHGWGCPVVMKLDPHLVAWTCADCGAIATAPAGAPPPVAATL